MDREVQLKAALATAVTTTTVALLALSACQSSQTVEEQAPIPPPPVLVEPAPPPPPSANIVVTGQRIQRPTMSSPTAVTVIGNGAHLASPLYTPVQPDRERYDGKDVSAIKAVADEPVSTFSVDVDTGSYANVRRFLTMGQLPPMGAVRTEEMINYFRYDYSVPGSKGTPFSVTTDMARTPWSAETRLLRIGINGYDLPKSSQPPTNLVFLVDVSGSMDSPDKLPLVKQSLSQLADHMSAKDKVSIVVYAGAAGVVLPTTSDPAAIKAALARLEAGGSTAGGQGLQLAYKIAKDNFIKGGVNRVMLATDGDFNVGVQSTDGIEQIVKTNREQGITLSTLGFGTGNYNEAMMERIADVGNGNYSYIDGLEEAQKVLSDEMAGTIFTIAKDVKVQIEFNPAIVKQYRLIGYENRILREEDFDNDKVDAGDIGSGHQVTALYEIVPADAKGWLPERRYEANKKAAKPGNPAELAWLKLRYKLPDGDTSKLIERAVPTSLIASARAPSGDMAFVTAVAAYGQKLRGDDLVAGLSWNAIRQLTGNQWQPTRKQFVELVKKAEILSNGASSTDDAMPPPPSPIRPMADNCGAAKVQHYTGKLASPATRAEIAKASGAGSVRWLEPNMMVTQDYRANRLNAHLSGNGKIGSFRCG